MCNRVLTAVVVPDIVHWRETRGLELLYNDEYAPETTNNDYYKVCKQNVVTLGHLHGYLTNTTK